VSGLGYIYLGLSLWQRKIAKDIMDTNDSGEPAICLLCCCGGKHCNADLYIQPDTFRSGEKVIQVNVDGNEECGTTYISIEQAEELIADLQKLLEFIKNE
jgi:hypothetical protein